MPSVPVPLLPGPMLLIWISSREDFLSTSMGELDQILPLQPRAAEEPLPTPARGAQTPLQPQHCRPREVTGSSLTTGIISSPKKPRLKPRLTALAAQKARAEGQGGGKGQLFWVPTRRKADGGGGGGRC